MEFANRERTAVRCPEKVFDNIFVSKKNRCLDGQNKSPWAEKVPVDPKGHICPFLYPRMN